MSIRINGMPELLKTIFEMLNVGTPIWLFVLAVILNFYLSHLRSIIKDFSSRRAAKAESDNANKETIVGLVQSARQTSRDISSICEHIQIDVGTLIAASGMSGTHADELATSYTRDFDCLHDNLSAFMEEMEAVDIYDGSHNNLLASKALLNRIRDIKSAGDDTRAAVQNTINRLVVI